MANTTIGAFNPLSAGVMPTFSGTQAPTALTAVNPLTSSFTSSPELGGGAQPQGTVSPIQELISQLQAEIEMLSAQLNSGQKNSGTQQQLQKDQQMLQALEGPSSSSGGDSGGGGGGGPVGGGGGGSSPMSGGSGGPAPTGGSGGPAPAGSSGPTGATPASATGSPSQAVQIAQSHMGQASDSFTMPNYNHVGGVTNDCADFVSGCVADAGTFKKSAGDASVATFSGDLSKQGWTTTTKPQAGDVAIVNGSQHAELVSGPNGQCIGSNGSSSQSISHDTPSQWGSVVYYQPPKQTAATPKPAGH